MNYFDRLAAADEQYWERFIEARRETLSLTAWSLESAIEYRHNDVDKCGAALLSLDAAEKQLYRLSPRTCTDYIDAWASDLREWEDATQRIRTVGDTAEVLDELGLENWYLVGDVSRSDASSKRGFTMRRSCTNFPSPDGFHESWSA